MLSFPIHGLRSCSESWVGHWSVPPRSEDIVSTHNPVSFQYPKVLSLYFCLKISWVQILNSISRSSLFFYNQCNGYEFVRIYVGVCDVCLYGWVCAVCGCDLYGLFYIYFLTNCECVIYVCVWFFISISLQIALLVFLNKLHGICRPLRVSLEIFFNSIVFPKSNNLELFYYSIGDFQFLFSIFCHFHHRDHLPLWLNSLSSILFLFI